MHELDDERRAAYNPIDRGPDEPARIRGGREQRVRFTLDGKEIRGVIAVQQLGAVKVVYFEKPGGLPLEIWVDAKILESDEEE